MVAGPVSSTAKVHGRGLLCVIDRTQQFYRCEEPASTTSALHICASYLQDEGST